MQASRFVPVDPEHAFDVLLVAPLPAIFDRRYAAMPPVREVRGQDGVWGTVGQTRTVATTDGGTLLETLTVVDRPHRFGYVLTDVHGPMRPLVRTRGRRVVGGAGGRPARASAGPGPCTPPWRPPGC